MGGYARYVWTSYGLARVGLLANVLGSARQMNSTKQQTLLKAQQQAKKRR
jgi:heme exporter protein CcmD